MSQNNEDCDNIENETIKIDGDLTDLAISYGFKLKGFYDGNNRIASGIKKKEKKWGNNDFISKINKFDDDNYENTLNDPTIDNSAYHSYVKEENVQKDDDYKEDADEGWW